jgi:hypothetical protein
MTHCEQIAELLDRFLDRELDASQIVAVEHHLGECEHCTLIVANRKSMQVRMRQAVRSVAAPADLGARIHSQLSSLSSRGDSKRTGWVPLAMAAGIFVAIGAAVSWERHGSVPSVRDAQRIAASTPLPAPEVSPVMQVGLKDHVHCAVYHGYRDGSGPEFHDLEHVLEENLPPTCKVVSAHLCSFEGREYVHVVARGHNRLLSLIVTKRGEGEGFDNGPRTVASANGTPFYTATAGQFNLAGFETAQYLVYLISDFGGNSNLAMLQAMTPRLKTASLARFF